MTANDISATAFSEGSSISEENIEELHSRYPMLSDLDGLSLERQVQIYSSILAELQERLDADR